MKMWWLLILGSLVGCSPQIASYEHTFTTEQVTQYGGQAPNKHAAISAVQSFISSGNDVLACAESSFNAIEVLSTTESNKVTSGDTITITSTVYVDEWGVEEKVSTDASRSYAARLWSVNGRTGTVKLVGGLGFGDNLESCTLDNLTS